MLCRPQMRRIRIESVLDLRSRTDALANYCVQLRRHPPRGPRCQPRPQPPATATTWLVSSAAFTMAAPLAGLASALDALSVPSPTATMTAASMARIWFLLLLADTLGRVTASANPGRPANDPPQPPELQQRHEHHERFEPRIGWSRGFGFSAHLRSSGLRGVQACGCVNSGCWFDA